MVCSSSTPKAQRNYVLIGTESGAVQPPSSSLDELNGRILSVTDEAGENDELTGNPSEKEADLTVEIGGLLNLSIFRSLSADNHGTQRTQCPIYRPPRQLTHFIHAKLQSMLSSNNP